MTQNNDNSDTANDVTKSPPSMLFQPLQLGHLTLSHRIVLAPLTRQRSDDAHVPMPFVATYYAQRGCVPGTLLITEATFISPRGAGYENVPGVWTPAQAASWRTVTTAVHAARSHIFCQLWALGRAANPETKRAKFDLDVVGPSALPMPPLEPRVPAPATPRALSEPEIWELIADYAAAARTAVDTAGFDGVEIHAANGYLIDQFTQDVSNARTDAWGGDVPRRCRFALEVAAAVAAAVGPHRVGIRLSPYSTFQGMKMADPGPTFAYLARRLAALDLAYLHVVEARVAGGRDNTHPDAAHEKINFMADAWRDGNGGAAARPVLVAGGYTPESARRCVDDDYAGQDVAVVFGRWFISNPDLAFRVREGVPLAKYNRDTFYKVMSEDGYTDYAFCDDFDAAKEQQRQVSLPYRFAAEPAGGAVTSGHSKA